MKAKKEDLAYEDCIVVTTETYDATKDRHIYLVNAVFNYDDEPNAVSYAKKLFREEIKHGICGKQECHKRRQSKNYFYIAYTEDDDFLCVSIGGSVLFQKGKTQDQKDDSKN